MLKPTKSLLSGKPADELESDQVNQRPNKRRRFFYFFVMMDVLGFMTAVHAVISTRRSQGTIAWAIGSILFPYVTVPAYRGLANRSLTVARSCVVPNNLQRKASRNN